MHALADESRRTVLEILRDRPASAGELAEALPIARPGVSGISACCGKPGWSTYARTRSAGSTPSAPRRSSRSTSGWAVPPALGEPARRAPYRDRTRKEGTMMTTIATMRALDETRGAVRSNLYDTDIGDLGRRARRPSAWPAGSPASTATCGSAARSRSSSRAAGPSGARRGVRRPPPPAADDEPARTTRADRGVAERGGAGVRLVVEERGLPVSISRSMPLDGGSTSISVGRWR